MKSFRIPGLKLILTVLAGALLAQLAVPGLSRAQTTPPTEANTTTAVTDTVSHTVSLDASDASVTSILSILASKGNLNIITGQGVANQRLTIHMKDTPIEQAVNLVVRAAGLGYEQIGNSVLVADHQSLREETGLGTYVVPLKYLSAPELKILVQDLAKETEVDSGSNSLIVKCSPRTIADIQGIVNAVDKPVPQIEIEARIVEVSTDDLTQLGIDWSNFNSFKTIITQNNPGGGSTSNTGAPDQLPTNIGYHDITESPHLFMQDKALRVTLDWIINRGNGKLLANPRLITTNGHEASMLVGQTIPFVVTGVVQGAGGVTQSQFIQKEEVGVKLRVTPKVNADGYITTSITPELSSVNRFTGPDNTLPIVDRRVATTTVRLKDGASVVIGGLLNEQETKVVTKVPILGDIPGLGYLFRHNTEVKRKTDLIIEITPRLLK